MRQTDSADDIKKCLNCEKPKCTNCMGEITYTGKRKNAEQCVSLIRPYIDGKVSAKKMALQIGCDPRTVRRWGRKYAGV